MNLNRILFPVDLSEFSSKIVPQVISVAEKFGAEIHLVAVVEPEGFGTPITQSPGRLEPEPDEQAERKLQEFEQESFVNYRNVKRVLLHGDPASEILKYINSAGIDLVIMATHRKKGLERALLGSVADEVIRKSPVPVMSINPQEHEMGWRVSNVRPEEELKLRPNWREGPHGQS